VRAIFGPVVRITYGKTEIFNPITVLPPSACDASFAAGDAGRGANLGWPASGVEIEIRGEDGARQPPETPGRIFIRAPHAMAGHLDGEGFHPVDAAGWHESGDIGLLSARGELFLAGRDHEMIKTGGFKIFPHEVEAALQAAAAGREIVAVGVPSDYWGQIVVAVAEQGDAGWERRAEGAVAVLSKHKRPRAYLSLPAFPRNAQGKLQRGRIVELLLQHYRIEDGPRPAFQRV
jgi:acyl-CoA synthetase (AMP-forming)/AMP-acid ligase II